VLAIVGVAIITALVAAGMSVSVGGGGTVGDGVSWIAGDGGIVGDSVSWIAGDGDGGVCVTWANPKHAMILKAKTTVKISLAKCRFLIVILIPCW
jgi:hypothetical protein